MTSPTRKTRILVVDDDPAVVELLVEELQSRYDAIGQTSSPAALAQVIGEDIDLVIADIEMPDLRGTDLLAAILEHKPNQLVVLITGFGSIELAVQAVRTGACDFIAKPFKMQDLILAIERALREHTMRREIVRLRRRLGEDEHGEIVARSPAMRRVVEIARRASRSRANVLITGDSGTGKSAVARWIHHHGDRRDGPFVHVRCATLPAIGTDLELFGRRGASPPEGLFAEASGGTLLLDEICELSPEGQRSLLEALEHAKLAGRSGPEAGPTGSMTRGRPDTRVVATTNRPLAESIRTGKLTRELSYALNVIPIHVPPLRERAEDVPELVRQLLARTPDRAIGIADAALQWLVEAQWTGNVRELASVLQRAVALSDRDTLTVEDLEREQSTSPEPISSLMGSVADRQLSLAEVERGYIECVLAQTSRNITRTARILGIDRRTLHRKLASLG